MKTFLKAESGKRKAQNRECGMATIIFIALLAIMMMLVMAETKALFHLHREVKFLEQKQIKRLNTRTTNTVAVITHESK